MTLVNDVGQVFEAIQHVKAGATDFRTNFFPIQAKLETWIKHGEFAIITGSRAVFFFKKDRDFWHLHFSASSLDSLCMEMAALSELKSERVLADVLGKEGAMEDLIDAFTASGFRSYTRMVRLARTGQSPEGGKSDDPRVIIADREDRYELLSLIERSFDPYKGQFPWEYEMDEALKNRQVLAAKVDGKIAGLIFFETQGFTSTVRYWLVANGYRDQKLGGALMHRYFASQPSVKRFILWVAANNDDAIRKYNHYGYKPDGLIDIILANQMIQE